MPPRSPTPESVITLSGAAGGKDAGNPESPPMTETPSNNNNEK
jgi:hypothetical protein